MVAIFSWQFDSKEFPPLAAIRVNISRKAKTIHGDGIVAEYERHENNNEEIGTDESESDNNRCDDVEFSNEGIDETEQAWNNTVAGIKHCIMKRPDL